MIIGSSTDVKKKTRNWISRYPEKPIDVNETMFIELRILVQGVVFDIEPEDSQRLIISSRYKISSRNH